MNHEEILNIFQVENQGIIGIIRMPCIFLKNIIVTIDITTEKVV